MANELGMFGVMPEDIQRQIQEGDNNEAYRMAQLSPGRVGVAVAGQQSRMAGRAIESALGIEDPRVKRAKEMQAIVQEIQGQEGMDDPATFYETMAKKLAERGFMNEATAMYSKVYASQKDKADRDVKRQELQDKVEIARERNKTAERIAELRSKGKDPDWQSKFEKDFKDLVKEFGGEAVGEYHRLMRQTDGDYAVASEALKKSPKFSEGKWVTTPDGRSAFMQQNTETGEMEIKGTGGTNVNIGEKADSQISVKRTIRNEEALEKQVDSATKMVPYINMYKEIIKRSIITGTGADWRTAITRLGVTLGFKKNAELLNDTDLFDAIVVDLVLPKMKELSGSDSNEELKQLLNSVGNRKSDPKVLEGIVGLLEKKTKDALERSQRYESFLADGGSPTMWNFRTGTPYGQEPKETTTKSPTKPAKTSQSATTSQSINDIPMSAIRRYQEQVKKQLGRDITDEQAAAKLAASRKQ